jgi:diguanylate cyclase (GGDEF)-like protein
MWFIDWGEAVFIVAAAVVPVHLLPALFLLGILTKELWVRRRVQQTLFAIGSWSIYLFLGSLAISAVNAHGEASRLLAFSAGAVALTLTSQVGVTTIFSVVRKSNWFGIFAEATPLSAINLGINVPLGVSVLLLAKYSPLTLILTPPCVIAMFAVYRHYGRTKVERDLWKRLDEVELEAARLQIDKVIELAAAAACELFRADSAEIILDPDFEPESVAAEDVLVEELPGTMGPLGFLKMTFDGPAQPTDVERRVLLRFAHAIAATVVNAHLHGETVELAERNHYQATHDDLTGLMNRIELQSRVDALLSRGKDITLLLLDLEHIKEVNDTLGMGAGDQLLIHVANRLRTGVRSGDLVARVGGDEFAVILTDLPSPELAEIVASALLAELSAPIEVDGLALTVEATAGIASGPTDSRTAADLLMHGHVALQLAKSGSQEYESWTEERDPSSLDRLKLLAELKQALADDELVLNYQPKTDMVTGRMTGSEVLVRWQHPRRGLLGPGFFVPAVETSGLVHAFTRAVLDKALKEFATWVPGLGAGTLAVNLSARNLLDRSLPQDVAKLLARHGVAAERVVLEITETSMMSELELVEEVLADLRDIGVKLSVDDFGTGFSSLTLLQRIAVNEVKVDRSFVMGMTTVESDLIIVRAIIDLAHGLGLRVVAEGVEDKDQLDKLAELGCDQVQGYYLAKPMIASDLIAYARKSQLGGNVVPIQAIPAQPVATEHERLESVDRLSS